MSQQYLKAGVDITAGNRAVNLMKEVVRSTYGPEVLAGIGAFGGMFDASRLKTLQEPVLVASTDGVGTKVHLALQAGRLKNIGYDLVNHSINDILVQNARPLFFMDYVASDKIHPEEIALIVEGLSAACREVRCALLGGETAEMPGTYQPHSIDLAGTIVGVVEKAKALPKQAELKAGDVLLGLASSGPHTNGYSLMRKVFENMALDTFFNELNQTLIEALLAPHRCYLPVLEKALDHPEQPIKALIHITGGGFYENIPRVLPDHLGAKIEKNAWPIPPLFQLIQSHGSIDFHEMCRVFNMGVGMIVVAAPEKISLLQSLITESIWQLGELVTGERKVTI